MNTRPRVPSKIISMVIEPRPLHYLAYSDADCHSNSPCIGISSCF
uniref:Uncharacterized protein n=1 Tax=Rhizophora mucronata TaxID=61149 RepID=A0A2P2NDS6_RHIMU